MATTQETLAAVNIAIHNLMTGGAVQSYTLNGRDIQYFSLKELMDLRSMLQQEIASSSGSRNYAKFKNPQ